MNQKLPSVFITIGLSIFLLITCSCEGETQKAEPLSSTDASYQTKEPEKIDNKFNSPNDLVLKSDGSM